MALLAGPLLGALMILVTNMPLVLLNIVSGVVYAVVLPFVALATVYVYFDMRVRGRVGVRGEGGRGGRQDHRLPRDAPHHIPRRVASLPPPGR